MPTLCLNMIVKNESKTLPNLFNSLHKIIDYYVILDTGSTDGTPELITKIMNDYNVKGEVFHSEWVNFSVCRNKALQYSVGKGDYILIIDADEELHYVNDTILKNLNKDCYYLKRKYGSIEYYLPAIINIQQNNKLNWIWKGPVHNYLSSSTDDISKEYIAVEQIWIKSIVHGGAKSHNVTIKEKYLLDAKLLKEELKKNPNDTRSQFYLAQSYKDAQEYEKAIIHYKKRVVMGGWDEEIYYSLYCIGLCKELSGKYSFENEILLDYLKAFNYRNTRLEALYHILMYYRKKRLHQKALAYGILGYKNNYPNDQLFVNVSIHKYRFIDELSVAAYWSGFYQLSYDLSKKILDEKYYPEREFKRITDNIQFSYNKLNTITRDKITTTNREESAD